PIEKRPEHLEEAALILAKEKRLHLAHGRRSPPRPFLRVCSSSNCLDVVSTCPISSGTRDTSPIWFLRFYAARYAPTPTLSAQLGGLATQLVFVRRYAAYEHHACCQRPNVLAASRTDRGAVPMRVGVGLPSTVPGATSDTLRAWARDADGGPFSSLGV